MTRALRAAGATALLVGFSLAAPGSPGERPTTLPPARADTHPGYAGASACAGCHARETRLWRASDHALAMQRATPRTVRGDFNGATFTYDGVTSVFFRRGDRFMVRTDGPDGAPAEYEVAYTFGVTPLQQYLLALPGGRYQPLGIAWDTRPKKDGGQRWFHLYPGQGVDFRDPLHWTSRYQNWNLQCAECHSTDLRKNYDAASDTYRTSFSEINVSCEACHGPRAQHVEWARRGSGALRKSAPSDAAPAATMNACWPCHARRSTIAEGGAPGGMLEDTHRPALLAPPLYYVDGQQRDEVYTWGSFRQSRMFQRGVTCAHCHEPHGLTLRAEGNALCTRCHDGGTFDTEKHHFHRPGTAGARCVECHAPAQRYMVIDARHDHSFRVPRPDLSPALGSPNACTLCHEGRSAEWAAQAMDRWYGPGWRSRPQYGPALAAGLREGVRAVPPLLALAADPGWPAVVRASAASLAQSHARPANLPAVRPLLRDPDPSVRIAALGLLESLDPRLRAPEAAPLLADPVRGVRIEAVRILADVPDRELPPAERGARETAEREYVAALARDADWPGANVSLGNLRVRQGRVDEGVAAYQRALSLDPRLVEAYVNLADAYRIQSRDDQGEAALRRGLSLLPRAADLHHSLGLLLVRRGEPSAATAELEAAARQAPENPRYAYVYAVALHSAGKRAEALTVLETALARQPYDVDVLGALVSMHREAGNLEAARAHARRLGEALPEDPAVRRLQAELEGRN